MAKQRTAVLYLRVEPELRERLVKLADASGTTVSETAGIVLARGLGLKAPIDRLVELLPRDTPNAP